MKEERVQTTNKDGGRARSLSVLAAAFSLAGLLLNLMVSEYCGSQWSGPYRAIRYIYIYIYIYICIYIYIYIYIYI